MKRILLAPFLFTGHLFHLLALAQGFRRLGHRVVCYCEPEGHRFVRLAGCVPVEMPAGDVPARFRGATRERPMVRLLSDLAEGVAPHMMEVIRRHRIDVVVSDRLHLGAALAAERSGLPWATLSTTPAELSPKLAKRAAQGRIDTRALRRRVGLSPTSAGSLEQGLSPHLHVLAWTPDFDLGPAPPQSLHVGPLSWEAPGGRRHRWLEGLDADRPVVLVSVTSVPFDALAEWTRYYLHVAVAALERLDVQGIVTLAGGGAPDAPEGTGRVRIERFVPHGLLMPRLDALVTHGGWGAVARALTAGVPMAVVPFALDHASNASMVERRGFGFRIALEKLTEEGLARRVRQLIARDCPQREAVREVSRRWRRLRPADTAARRIMALAT